MDRFIVSCLHSKTNENFYLKSNMDRFIDISNDFGVLYKIDLKSNMDRFIVCFPFLSLSNSQYLKSNMDRFIVKVFSRETLN